MTDGNEASPEPQYSELERTLKAPRSAALAGIALTVTLAVTPLVAVAVITALPVSATAVILPVVGWTVATA